jgi:hypothetical protein
MITFKQILEMHGLESNKVRFIRHGNKEIPILETFSTDIHRLETYQSFQKPKKFGDAKLIAVFAPHHKTTALFLGLWDIESCTTEFTNDIKLLLKEYDLPASWIHDSIKYDLKRNNTLDDLSERLVIEWGGSTVSWVQSKDKEIIEIKGKESIEEFQSFSLIHLDFKRLKKIIQSPDTNLTWMKALSSVNGVYLIQETVKGKLYVGSAYGEQGIYGRWSVYAKNGHGGNKRLIELDPDTFKFSILEIVPATATIESVIECENRWKEKLGTREFGLNDN